MSALDVLKERLRRAMGSGVLSLHQDTSIDHVLADMRRLIQVQGCRPAPVERQMEAVQKFWDTKQIIEYRDAYFVCWGLCLPHVQGEACVLDDSERFDIVLSSLAEWKLYPRAFRRCYRGLVSCYFTYGSDGHAMSDEGRANWQALRSYLYKHNELIRDKEVNPAWVDVATRNPQLFQSNPCAPYAEALLCGNWQDVRYICETLGISQTSWFQRELILSQIKAAAQMEDDAFGEYLPTLLEQLQTHHVLRDRGLALLLNRYVQVSCHPLHKDLRDRAVEWWGNPWLPSNKMRWSGVEEAARVMVADWLKGEFIEAFFAKMADDHMGDERRMRFWKRYLKSMDHVEFALGDAARHPRSRDFKLLLQKIEGLTCELDNAGNAFIMYMGDLVAVEFSERANACYGYRRNRLPFNTSRKLHCAVGIVNSLKHDSPRRELWLKHQDGIDAWEDKFREEIRNRFGILPDDEMPQLRVRPKPRKPRILPYDLEDEQDVFAVVQSDKTASRRLASASTGVLALGSAANGEGGDGGSRLPSVKPSRAGDATLGGNPSPSAEMQPKFSRSALRSYAKARQFGVDDRTSKGGALWALTDDADPDVSYVLCHWGFQYKAGKGWWKTVK